MRKYNGNSAYSKQCPIGILPLGEINRTANHLFNKKYDNLSLVRQLADATMATIKGSTKYIDVVELESLEVNLLTINYFHDYNNQFDN